MSWPIPAPMTIASDAAGVYESTFAGIDARSANSVAATNCRIVGLTAYDLYLYQGYIAQEVMPDTSVDWLYRHANIWGVPRLGSTVATGNAGVIGFAGTVVPAGTLATAPGGALYVTTATVTIAAGVGGAAVVPISSVLAGSAYNLSGGTTLQLVSPIAGLVPQSMTLDSNGAANGTDPEPVDSWRSRVLARIRTPPQGGAAVDYITWALAAGAGYALCVPNYIGPGSVGVVIAAAGPAVASSQLVSIVQGYIGPYGQAVGVRPVTANAIVVAASLVPVNVSLTLNPDNIATRAAATSALQLFFRNSAMIGGTVYMSRLDNAVSNASGEYSHERQAPTGDVSVTATQMPVMGTVTFVPGS